MCGMIAGGVAAVSTTPLDVVKTRVMLEARVGVTRSHLRRWLIKDHREFDRNTTIAFGPLFPTAAACYRPKRGIQRIVSWMAT